MKLFTHLSICDRNFVSKMPLVFSVSEICPRKRNPRLVRSIKICLTISPRYMPLHIFSYLRCIREITKMTKYPLRKLQFSQKWQDDATNVLIQSGELISFNDRGQQLSRKSDTESIFTFVFLHWASSRPLPGRTSSWCHPGIRCLRTPPTPYWHTYGPRFPPLSQCSSTLPYNRRYCPSLRGDKTHKLVNLKRNLNNWYITV